MVGLIALTLPPGKPGVKPIGAGPDFLFPAERPEIGRVSAWTHPRCTPSRFGAGISTRLLRLFHPLAERRWHGLPETLSRKLTRPFRALSSYIGRWFSLRGMLA